MNRKAFSPFEDGVGSGISQEPAIEGALADAVAGGA
jgi:hypothetical protein